MTPAQRKRLPKANLVHFEWVKPILPGRALFQRNRLANAMRLRVGNIVVIVRMPWLEHSARTLYPHIFAA